MTSFYCWLTSISFHRCRKLNGCFLKSRSQHIGAVYWTQYTTRHTWKVFGKRNIGTKNDLGQNRYHLYDFHFERVLLGRSSEILQSESSQSNKLILKKSTVQHIHFIEKKHHFDRHLYMKNHTVCELFFLRLLPIFYVKWATKKLSANFRCVFFREIQLFFEGPFNLPHMRIHMIQEWEV